MATPLTSAELDYARAYIGPADADNGDTDVAFQARFDRLFKSIQGDYPDITSQRARALDLAVQESMQGQLSKLLAQPAQAASGNDSYSTGANITELAKQLKEFRDIKGTNRAKVARMVRRSASRRR